jgi:hypothetical protein
MQVRHLSSSRNTKEFDAHHQTETQRNLTPISNRNIKEFDDAQPEAELNRTVLPTEKKM